MTEPAGDATLPHPDHVETVDALGAAARAARVGSGGPTVASEPQVPRPEPEAHPLQIGRYRLLELVGTGGMGMVWGAWDPELERRVALKLVRHVSLSTRDRIQREGQVLARLSHPNVVPIFDVGVVGESIYLVMEWAGGTTLRSYAAQGPGVPALVDAYRQAGDGLAAAHRAGVTHRDFKPDNAVRGDDGRVRVLDFGLAFASDDTLAPEQRRAGTRRYMAPEQERGDDIAPACDQYAFAVSLREALAEAGGVPGWIAAIVDRATAADPAQRYAGMAELLAALDRDPARRRRRLGLGAIGALAIGGLAAGAFAIGGSRSAAAIAPCSGGPAEIAAAWSPARRAEVTAHLARAGASAAEAERLGGQLDRYAASWVGVHRGACLARERQELTPVRYEERRACLARTRAALDATAGVLAGADRAGLAGATIAAGSLPDVAACIDDLGQVVPPPAAVAAQVAAVVPDVERALVYAKAERQDAVELARKATAEARATSYTPLVARALLVEGRAELGATREGRAAFEEATMLALASFQDAMAVEAYARMTFVRAINGETEVENWTAMEALANRLGDAGRFERALLYHNRAVTRRAAGDAAGALAMFRHAAEVRGDLADAELTCIDQSLAVAEPDPDDSARAARRGLATSTALVGPDHPKSLAMRFAVSLTTRDLGEARRLVAPMCRMHEALGQQTWDRDCSMRAGWLADQAGDATAAIAWMTIAADDPDPEASRGPDAYVAMATDRPDAAAKVAALARYAAGARPTETWNIDRLAEVLTVVALAEDRWGHTDAATRAWTRVVALHEQTMQMSSRRDLVRAQAVLAERLVRTQPAEARRLATAALAWYRGVPADAALVARLEEIAR